MIDMIYTITTNPSLDYYIYFPEDVSANIHNRSVNEHYDCGGKGVNVSIFLNELGINTTALGFLGGFTKDYYLELIRKYRYIQPLFTSIEEATRINVKAIATNETSLNAKGPHISEEEFERFEERLTKIFKDDIVVLSGNIQDELRAKICNLVRELTLLGVRVVLDSDQDIMDECKMYKPYCIKLNERDAGLKEERIQEIAMHYLSAGVDYVLYSSPLNENYYLFHESGFFKAKRHHEIQSITGVGDAMIAGFLYAKLRGANPEEAFRYGVTCSDHLRFSNEIIDKANINQSAKELEVTKI